ncbi:tRNA-2-methylthio-N(6)-dimethylallyladenosine synthase, partial [Frankliniella fusca]
MTAVCQCALQQAGPSAAYIAKYNRFVDTILERVNKILRRSYDPVNVKLTPGEKAAVKSADKDKKKKKKKNKNANKQQQRDGEMMAKTEE